MVRNAAAMLFHTFFHVDIHYLIIISLLPRRQWFSRIRFVRVHRRFLLQSNLLHLLLLYLVLNKNLRLPYSLLPINPLLSKILWMFLLKFIYRSSKFFLSIGFFLCGLLQRQNILSHPWSILDLIFLVYVSNCLGQPCEVLVYSSMELFFSPFVSSILFKQII